MNYVKTLVAVLTALLLIVSLAPTAQADEWNKKTILTVTEPIQLPNQVLQPGTYVLKLLDSPSNRHIVQVFDKDEQHLITTVLAIPNYRLQPRGKSEFQFWEVPAGQPKAMRAWFYPGDNFGQEFAYPKETSAQIAALTHTAVPTTSAKTAEEMANANVSAVDESGNTKELNKEVYTRSDVAATPEPAPKPEAAPPPPPPPPQPEPRPAPEQAAPPVPEPMPAPTPAPATTPAELPHTASNMPLIGLMGLLSLAAFSATVLRKRAR